MHELTIVQNVLEICETHAGANSVGTIKLEIGVLSGVTSEAIEFCFEACAKGTKLERATLQIDKIMGVAKCRACSTSFEIAAVFDACPNCQSFSLEILSGKEMRVCEIELRNE